MRKIIVKYLCGILVYVLFVGSINVIATESMVARLSTQQIYVDAVKIENIKAYNISGNNYVRLRDIAKAVDFYVFYDVMTDSIHIDRSKSYEGGELDLLPDPGDNVAAVLSTQKTYVKSIEVNFTVYNIAGNNYIKLRDIGGAINLGMAYDPATDSIYIDRKTAYLQNMPPELLRPEAIPKITTNTSEWKTIADLPTEIKAKLVNFPQTAKIGIDTGVEGWISFTYPSKREYVVDSRLVVETIITTQYLYVGEPGTDAYEYFPLHSHDFEIKKAAYAEGVPFKFGFLAEEYKAVLPFLNELKGMSTDTEKINAIIRYVCERMVYGHPDDEEIYLRREGQYVSMRYAMFLDPPPVKGVCIDYSKATYLLCEMAKLHSTIMIDPIANHAWLAVYADGEWYYADPTNNFDYYKDPTKNLLIAIDRPYLPFTDQNPEETKRIMEDKVPGSTK